MARTLLVLTMVLLALLALAQEGAPATTPETATETATDTAETAPPYLDPDRPVEERVDDLLGRMTLEEKVGQMAQINLARLTGSGEWDPGPLNEAFVDEYLVELGVGSVLSGGGFAPVPNTPRAWAETTNALQRVAVEETRLGIPLLYGIDAVHGHTNVQGATVFPHNIGVAASRDPELARRIARSAAEAMRATGVHWNFGPVVDVGVDPRWGRFYETFGEDPLLASAFVRAAVEGYQQGDLDAPGSVAATVKHFVGYGAGAAGRDRAPADLSLRALLETHLPPARAGLEAGAATVMANSGAVNGVPVHASQALLGELLRGDLGFEGLVVSDWEDLAKLQSVHRIAADRDAAIAMGVTAGVDMAMIPNDARGFTGALLDLVETGEVAEARVDEAVRRILALKVALGLFEEPYVDARRADDLVVGADLDLAREAAAASMTLLANDGVLPLESAGTRLLVTGPSADDLARQMGGWTIGWQGLPDGAPLPPGTTFLEGLRAALGYAAVTHAAEADAAVAAARSADVALVFVGEEPYAEGEGDRAEPALEPAQLELARRVAATGTPTVLVVVAGRPLLLPDDLLAEVDALLMAYLPGSGGGPALADVLLGAVAPGGRLPFSWPRSAGQLPLDHRRAPGRAYDPLFPFGHGLGTTEFALTDPRTESTVRGGARPRGSVALELDVTNVGDRPGREVVEVYLERPPSGVLVPERELVAFARVALEPAESRSVAFEIPAERLGVLTGDVGEVGPRAVVPGTYTLHVGELRATVTVE